jgi:hypothetical protein
MTQPRSAMWTIGSLVFLFGLSSFALTYAITLRLEKYRVFELNDVLFGDDPIIKVFVSAVGENAFRHPNLSAMFGQPIRVGAKVTARIIGGDEKVIARHIGLGVGPLAGSCQLAALLLAFYRLGLSFRKITLLGLVLLASFSHLVFSSIPSHFILTGAGLAILYFLCLWSLSLRQLLFHVIWIVVGIVLTGITTTNIIPWLVFYGATSLKRTAPAIRISRAFAPVVVSLILVCLATVLIHVVVSVKYHGTIVALEQLKNPRVVKDTKRWVHEDWYSRVPRFPIAFVRTFVPGAVVAMPRNRIGEPVNSNLCFPQGTSFHELLGAVLCSSLLLSGVIRLSRSDLARWICCLALFDLAFNIALVSIYGDDELFLYSQHWFSSLAVLLAGASLPRGRASLMADIGLTTLFVLESARSFQAWQFIFESIVM